MTNIIMVLLHLPILVSLLLIPYILSFVMLINCSFDHVSFCHNIYAQVDDVLLTRNNIFEITLVKTDLHSKFRIKDP